MIIKENVDIKTELKKLLKDHSHAVGKMPNSSTEEEYSFAIYHNKKLVGGLVARHKNRELYISLLAVEPAQRGTGIGKQLMELAEIKARELDCNHVLLTTYSYQGAEFYPKIGFTEIGRITNYPEPNVDKIYFIKQL